MLGANIVRLASPSDLLVNLKQVISQPKHKNKMNPRLCPLALVFNGAIKPGIFQQLIEC